MSDSTGIEGQNSDRGAGSTPADAGTRMPSGGDTTGGGPQSAEAPANGAEPQSPAQVDPMSEFFSVIGRGEIEKDKSRIESLIGDVVTSTIGKQPISADYNVLIFHSPNAIVHGHADKIYEAVKAFGKPKPLLLVLFSPGGQIDAAYLIGKLCREFSTKHATKFAIVVPRQAKSAATLLCCGADELHMGSLSELGPIDPQIDGVPVLGLKDAVDHLADLVEKHPAASKMFAAYLRESMPLINLGYYERVAKSAVQYAERLLRLPAGVQNKLKKNPTEIARKLVYSYQDHSFVIDKEEATDIFSSEIVNSDSKEYSLGNAVYEELSRFGAIMEVLNYNFSFVGSCESGCNLSRKSRRPSGSFGA